MYGSFEATAAAATDLNRPFAPLPTHQNQMSPGLLRYRSAPSSLLAEICQDFTPDSDSILSRFLQSDSSSHLPPPPPVFHQPPPQNQNIATSSSAMITPSSAADMITKNSRLARQTSSPAGLFSNIESGYGVMRGISANNGTGLRRQSSLMSQISENESIDDWEDIKGLTENVNTNFLPMKRARENHSEQQSGLSHHLSLPKEMEAMEKFLQFQDSVPCKIRAKRGCATHPRSIAERVRRTKISERMRKLQELVPNMDKQTNTADMLDLAVDYIKELQKQVKTISDIRANCTCSRSEQKPYTHPAA